MNKNTSKKIPRREANYLSLQEWIKKKKIPRKLNDDVSTLEKYAITHPLASRRQEQRHDKMSRSIERV